MIVKQEFDGVQKNFEQYDRGMFGHRANPEARYIEDYESLESYVNALRTLGMKLVLTSGSFDLIHVGHARYLEKAAECGDMLIVGVDADEKVRKRKGKDRPVVPQEERVQMLAHFRSVDIITLKKTSHAKWELIKRVKPDTLIATKETYSKKQLNELEKYCGRILVLEPQATTSTSAQIRRLQIGWSNNVVGPVKAILEDNSVPKKIREKIQKSLLNARGDA